MANKLYFDVKDIPKTDGLAERIMLPHRELNYCLNGLITNRVSILLAPTDSGKSCFCAGLIVSAIKQKYKVFLFDGENDEQEARDALYRQYLTFDKENFVYQPYYDQDGKATNAGEYILKPEKYEEIDSFFEGNLSIYNNEFPATKRGLIGCLAKSHEEQGWKLAVIDNAEMFDLENSSNDNRAMGEIWKALRLFAQTKQVHIFIVCHIKKTERNIIRPEIFDAKGTSSATNIGKNILSLIRLDCLDKTTKEYKSLSNIVSLNGYDISTCDAVVEVLKTKGRRRGFVGLKFNKISNSYYEADKIKGFNEMTEPVLYEQKKEKFDVFSFDDLEEIDGDLPF